MKPVHPVLALALLAATTPLPAQKTSQSALANLTIPPIPVSVTNNPTVNLGTAPALTVDVRTMPTLMATSVTLKTLVFTWPVPAGPYPWPMFLPGSGFPSPGKRMVIKALNFAAPTAPDGHSPGFLRITPLVDGELLGTPIYFATVSTPDGMQIVTVPEASIALPLGATLHITWSYGALPYPEATKAYLNLTFYETND